VEVPAAKAMKPLKKEGVRLFLALMLIAALIVVLVSTVLMAEKPAGETNVFVGMDIAYGGEETANSLIDNISSFVNLVILGSLNLTTNTQALTRVCDHLYEKGLYFIVYVAFAHTGNYPPQGPDPDFFTNAQQKYGSKFLGIYLFDEAGGRVVDRAHSVNLNDTSNYSEVALTYVNQLHYFLMNMSGYYSPAKLNLYSSDYALYWYDYVAGYGTIFGEYLPGHNRQVTTAFCRGAATTLDKDWGAVITWSNQSEPFIEAPPLMYDDMVYAYQNNAKYIIIFNSPDNFTQTQYGGLTPDHLAKMQQFWTYTQKTPNKQPPATTAFVLPKDYGYGFRGPNDTIWGKWQADSFSQQLWSDLNNQLNMHGSSLDVIYETKVNNETVNYPYQKLIFWNGTVIEK
jgi:hypothetical protein